MQQIDLGPYREKLLSLKIHRQLIPLLLCPQLLRSYGCGQVDVAGVDRSQDRIRVKIFEAKGMRLPTRRQRERLERTVELISFLMGCETRCYCSLNPGEGHLQKKARIINLF